MKARDAVLYKTAGRLPFAELKLTPECGWFDHVREALGVEENATSICFEPDSNNLCAKIRVMAETGMSVGYERRLLVDEENRLLEIFGLEIS